MEGKEEKMKEKSIFPHSHWVSCIDGLMLIVKKLGQLIDQKDERIKELSRKLQAASALKKTQLKSRIKIERKRI